MALVNGRSSGVFEVADQRLTLVHVTRHRPARPGRRGHTLARAKDQLRWRRPLYVPDTGTDRPRVHRGRQSGQPRDVPRVGRHELVGVLYVDSAEPHFCQASDVERLAKFSRMLARAVRPAGADRAREAMGWEAYLERTPVPDIERQKLLLLLNKNEWNIARVARLMGVTRRTVYLRLQRYNIPRARYPRRGCARRRRPRAASR